MPSCRCPCRSSSSSPSSFAWLQFREHGEALQWAVVAACAAAMTSDVPACQSEAAARCRLVFQGAEDTPATEVDFDPTDIDASVERIAAALHTLLRALLDDHAAAGRRGGFFFNRSRPEFKLRFLVDSAHIRHRMSIQLRARLQDQIAEWTQETRKATPSLLWQDEVGAP